MLDRDEDMLITGGRHPFYGKYKVGGRLLVDAINIALSDIHRVTSLCKVEVSEWCCVLSLQVGFLNSGKVVALDVSYYSNAGNSMDLSLSVSVIKNNSVYSLR